MLVAIGNLELLIIVYFLYLQKSSILPLKTSRLRFIFRNKTGWKLILILFYSILYSGTSELPEAILSILHESKIQLSVKQYACIFLLFSFMKFTSFKRLSRLGCLTSLLKSSYHVHNNQQIVVFNIHLISIKLHIF